MSRLLAEMQAILMRRGYDPTAARALHDEGMGTHELEGRLRFPPGTVGSLEDTHRIFKVIGAGVVLPRGLRMGMGSLRESMPGKVVGVQLNDNGEPIFHVAFEFKGRGNKMRERTTWVRRSDVQWIGE